MTLLAVMIFGVNAQAQTDPKEFKDYKDQKNMASLILQYNRIGLEYSREVNRFDLHASINGLGYDPPLLSGTILLGNPDRRISVANFPSGSYPDSIVNDTIYYKTYWTYVSEWDARLGAAYNLPFEKFSLVFGVDGVVGLQKIYENASDVVAYSIYDSSIHRNVMLMEAVSASTTIYKYLKLGVTPSVGIKVPLNRWSVGIGYNPEISWLSKLSEGYPGSVYMRSPVKRLKMKDQLTLRLGFSF